MSEPDDFVFCDKRWNTRFGDKREHHSCANHKPGHALHKCCCGNMLEPDLTRGLKCEAERCNKRAVSQEVYWPYTLGCEDHTPKGDVVVSV